MIIRKLQPKDVIPASKIVGLNYSKKYEIKSRGEIGAMFKNPVNAPQYLVAEENGKIIGFAGYIQSWMDYMIYQIFWVNVNPRHQSKGTGTLLVKGIIKEIKKHKGDNKAKIIQLTTTMPRFYKKFGFENVKLFHNEKEKPYYLMSLYLKK